MKITENLRFDFNVNSVIGILGFGVTWLWFIFGIMDDVKDTKAGLQATKIEVVKQNEDVKNELDRTNREAKKEISKIQNSQAQQTADLSAVRVTLENLSSMVLRIEQRQFNDRRGSLSNPNPATAVTAR